MATFLFPKSNKFYYDFSDILIVTEKANSMKRIVLVIEQADITSAILFHIKIPKISWRAFGVLQT